MRATTVKRLYDLSTTHGFWQVIRADRDGRMSFEIILPHNPHRPELPIDLADLRQLRDMLDNVLADAEPEGSGK